MWRLKQLMPKDQSGLEGKTVEVASLKLQIRSIIAQGGFSSVYLGRDAQSGKLFALKHIICNDSESLDLVKKEVAALKSMRGHPNIIALQGQSMYDMGRTKECFIVTEYCEKMMVEFLDARGAGYFDEKQLLLIFRDICNAVYAMHSESPPIAHRDLKAENLLLGNDGLWKLCDFGSVSTNHKRFEKPAEMGVEEDIIRKHTTPAYRAPEMWDLYRREIISEKVDIWALGCLLYRIAYLKSAFDGDSKLQILNGNYRIPDAPKYSTAITSLIKDMLNSNPEARPDALQVWHRVNSALPLDCQKASPDKAPSSAASHDDMSSKVGSKPSVVPSRAPPAPPLQKNIERGSPTPALNYGAHQSSSKVTDNISTSTVSKGGSFWSSQYASDAQYEDTNSPPRSKSSKSENQFPYKSKSPPLQTNTSPLKEPHSVSPFKEPHSVSPFKEPHSVRTDTAKRRGDSSMKMHFGSSTGDADPGYTRFEADNDSKWEDSSKNISQLVLSGDSKPDQAFIEFVADFQKVSTVSSENKGIEHEDNQVEIEKLRKELKEAQREKLEIASKYEKLTAICRSQRIEIQDLKSSLAAANNQKTSMEPSISHASSQNHQRQIGTVWDLQNGLKSSFEPQGWKAFSDASPKPVHGTKKDSYTNQKNSDEFSSANDVFGSARFDAASTNDDRKKADNHQHPKSGERWGFEDKFLSSGPVSTTPKVSNQGSQRNDSALGYNGKGYHSVVTNKPSGWSDF